MVSLSSLIITLILCHFLFPLTPPEPLRAHTPVSHPLYKSLSQVEGLAFSMKRALDKNHFCALRPCLFDQSNIDHHRLGTHTGRKLNRHTLTLELTLGTSQSGFIQYSLKIPCVILLKRNVSWFFCILQAGKRKLRRPGFFCTCIFAYHWRNINFVVCAVTISIEKFQIRSCGFHVALFLQNN